MKMSNPDSERAHRRQIYLLTCWQEQSQDPQTTHWRFKLETPGPKQKRLFESLGEILEAIEEELKQENRG